MRKIKTFKYISLVISAGIALLASGISGCITDPYSVGEPDSLFSEYRLVWDLVDSHYACFFAKEDVNWDEAYQKYREAATNLTSRGELVDLCLQMMGELQDQNLALRDSNGSWMESWNQGDFVNWDLTVWLEYMRRWTSPSLIPPGVTFDIFGAIELNPSIADNLGYIYISNLGSGYDWVGFFSETYTVAECSGLIFDLRMCGESGIESNAFYTCGRFVVESTLAYYRVFRVGPGRNDMGNMLPVLAYRNGIWQFTNPIVLLTGRYTQGAAEQLVLFLKTQQHVTVIGDTTAGFANPIVSFNLTEDWTIEIPEMVTYTKDNLLILNCGIAPDIVIPVSEADFAAGVDPVLDAAIEMLVP
ncbi:MAG: hypothetical protein KAR44_06000 [Candidatus Aegiribacteria sp.]|nr:hypothetical protein [Candidatus Aegiribacteria sp.]